MFSIQHDILDNFLTLVRISSESGDETEIVKYLLKRMKHHTNKVILDNDNNIFPDNVGNVLAHIKGKVKKPPLLLCAHMDTVRPGKNVEPIIKNNVILAENNTILGADDKAGIAAILTLLKWLHKEKLKHCPIDILFTASEEVGLLGSKNLNFSHIKSKIGFVLDSDGPIGTIVSKSPSHNIIKIVVEGKAAHAGMYPEKGVNSIKAASEAISKIQTGIIDKHTRINIGKIKGGISTNIVPPKTVVLIEVRSMSKVQLNKHTQKIIKVFKEVAKKYRAKIKTAEVDKVYSKYELPEKSKPIKLIKNVFQKISINPRSVVSFGGSDTNILNANGITTVNLGIGYKNPHTKKEQIKVNDLKKIAIILFSLIKTYSQE